MGAAKKYEERAIKIISTFLALAKGAHPDNVFLVTDDVFYKVISVEKEDENIVLEVNYNRKNRTQSSIKVTFKDKQTIIDLESLPHKTHTYIEDMIESYVRGERIRLRKIQMTRNIDSLIEIENINIDDVIKGG